MSVNVQALPGTDQLSASKDGAPEIINGVTLDNVRAQLQDAGYRAELVNAGGISFLRSASAGLGFEVRPGNHFADNPDLFADIAFVALFAVQGALPSDLLNKWNRTHRFGRLLLDRPVPDREFLLMSFDVSVMGGVSAGYLRGQLEIWNSLVQQLLPWLREELTKVASTIDTSAAAGSEASKSSEPANS